MEEKDTQKKFNSGPPYGEPNTTSLIITIIITLMGSGIFALIYLIIKNIG